MYIESIQYFVSYKFSPFCALFLGYSFPNTDSLSAIVLIVIAVAVLVLLLLVALVVAINT